MTFGNPNLLLFIIFAPLIMGVFHLFFLKRQKLIKSIFTLENFSKIGSIRSRGKLFLKSFLLSLCYILIIVALAEPRYGFKDITLSTLGSNIFIAVDVSLSMNATDILPNRLNIAKRKIIDLISLAKGERISLVPFAGEPYLLIPLTNDYSIFDSFIDIVNTDIIPIQGTNFYALVKKISDIVVRHKLNNSSIIVLSDGEDFSGNIEEAITLCKNNNITIYTVSIGTDSPTPIPIENGEFKKDNNGNIVTSKTNEPFLQDIALKTGGTFIRGSLTSKDIEYIYNKISSGSNDVTDGVMKKRIYSNRFQWFLLPAFLSLLLYFLIDERKKLKGVAVVALFTLIVSNLPLNAANPYFLNKKGIDYYNNDNFSEGSDYFKEAFNKDNNLTYQFNDADALYKKGDFDNASGLFDQIISSSQDNILKSKSYFNKGVINFRKSKFDEALKNFKEVLKLTPDDKDARINYELTLKTLEEMKKKESKKQNSCQNSNESKDNDTNKSKNRDDNSSMESKDKKSGNRQPNSGDNKSQQKQPQDAPKQDKSQQEQPKDSHPKDDKNREEGLSQSIENMPEKGNLDNSTVDSKLLMLYNDNKQLLKESIKKNFSDRKNRSEKDW